MENKECEQCMVEEGGRAKWEYYEDVGKGWPKVEPHGVDDEILDYRKVTHFKNIGHNFKRVFNNLVFKAIKK